jgi:hypothetical protein
MAGLAAQDEPSYFGPSDRSMMAEAAATRVAAVVVVVASRRGDNAEVAAAIDRLGDDCESFARQRNPTRTVPQHSMPSPRLHGPPVPGATASLAVRRSANGWQTEYWIVRVHAVLALASIAPDSTSVEGVPAGIDKSLVAYYHGAHPSRRPTPMRCLRDIPDEPI